MTKGGKYTVIHQFLGGSAGAEGVIPGSLVRDPAGNFYGSNSLGGSTGANSGTIFKLDTGNHLTVLHTFSGGGDGGNPMGRLIIDVNGNIHGTTADGGDATCKCGVVFKLDASGNEHVLHTFATFRDGEFPAIGLLDVGGTLYGATAAGGFRNCTGGCGVLYKISNTGKYSVLQHFNIANGKNPTGDLAHGSDGNIYGTANSGGSNGDGVFFKLTP